MNILGSEEIDSSFGKAFADGLSLVPRTHVETNREECVFVIPAGKVEIGGFLEPADWSARTTG